MEHNIQIILATVYTLPHPFNNEQTLTEDDIANIFFEDDKLIIQFAFEKLSNTAFQQFQRQLLKALKQELKIPKIQLNYQEPVARKKQSRMAELYPSANFIAVMSGKGGVGKSTVTYNLAKAFVTLNKKVAIIDADIYGASIAKIMQIPKTAPVAEGTKLKPYQKDDIELISSALIIQDDMPVLWKGPMLTRLLEQFMYDVAWSQDIDIFLIDMPPGTGDILFTLNDILPESKALLVTTPQEDAAYITIKSGVALQELAIEPLGIIENMAYTNCEHCQTKNYPFGKDGGVYVSEALGLPLFGSLPLQTPLQEEDLLDIAKITLKQIRKEQI